MTNELVKILSDIEELIKDWKGGTAPDEGEFIEKLTEYSEALAEELKKPPVKEEKPETC